jgi:hypothetical protein
MGGGWPRMCGTAGHDGEPSTSLQDGRGVGPHCEGNRNHPLSRHVTARRRGTGGV